VTLRPTITDRKRAGWRYDKSGCMFDVKEK
jgi:hypothetical protein